MSHGGQAGEDAQWYLTVEGRDRRGPPEDLACGLSDRVHETENHVHDAENHVHEQEDHVNEKKDHVHEIKNHVHEKKDHVHEKKDHVHEKKDRVREKKDQVHERKDLVREIGALMHANTEVARVIGTAVTGTTVTVADVDGRWGVDWDADDDNRLAGNAFETRLVVTATATVAAAGGAGGGR